MRHILKCVKCNSYGMTEECPCGGKRISPGPAKYSPEDKYAHYRREAKKILEDETADK